MLVRLLGKEEEALNGSWTLPFTDVPKGSTAYPYIGYAYANGLTNGTTATTYSGTNPIRANQYITFVLRAMGYVSGEDFTVGTAWELSDKLGITNGQYNAANAASFIRADVAGISASALSAPQKSSGKPLAEKLMAEKLFTQEQYDSAVNKTSEVIPEEPSMPKTAFGDAEFHELMMSYNPSSTQYGPDYAGSGNKTLTQFDSYMFADKFLASEFLDKINAMYSVAHIFEYTAAAGMYFEGTRVQATPYHELGPNISVHTFGKDGAFHCYNIFLSQ